MSRKLRDFEVGKYYHVFSRGVEKRDIFLEDVDYDRFFRGVFYFNIAKNRYFSWKRKLERDFLVEVEQFVLMPNHFHILLREFKEGGCSKFMHKLLTSYANYFNCKYNRFGSLMGSRFSAKIVDSEVYYEYLKGYIKNNPTKIIRSDYTFDDLFKGNIKLTKKEKQFVDRYPYFFDKNWVSDPTRDLC